MVIQKKNGSIDNQTDENGDVSQGRPSFASSIGSIME